MPDILIIGAERGLGLGLTHEFLGRGWNVVATAIPGGDLQSLQAARDAHPAWLSIQPLDVTDGGAIDPLRASLGDQRFDVIFLVAGIYGPLHQSITQASDAEFAEIMLVNAFGPARLAHRLLDRLSPDGTICFMSSHRASVAINVEGGLGLYRPSKVALNMLARSLWAENRDRNLTVLLIHPGWVNTAMGTLDGTVSAEIELEPSVRGVADVVERRRGSGENFYGDYQDEALPW